MVSERSSLLPFVLLSLSVHALLLLMSPTFREKGGAVEQIPISLLPEAPAEPEVKNAPPPSPNGRLKEVRRQRPAEPVRVAKKAAARPPSEAATKPVLDQLPVKEKAKEMPPERQRKDYTIVQRNLPTLKDLLPPADWSPSREDAVSDDEAVHLDTKEPRYISYFTSIKRAIEVVWEYPEPALRQGVEGKLILQFTVLGNGQLGEEHLIRSSGFPVLDREAMRAVQAASPFHPIPASIGKSRLEIVASFEYHDNRVKYGVVPLDR